MRTPIVTANWKMHKTIAESVALAAEVVRLVSETVETEVIVAPTFVALDAVAKALRGSTIGLAAQNLFWEPAGAFTGEISAPLLKAAGCSHVILGHSERRQHFSDTDEQINRRLHAALDHGLIPIVCVGEYLEDRQAGRTQEVVGRQLKGTLGTLTKSRMGAIVIAYEPVWAIGTGVTASADEAQEVHAFIRSWVSERLPEAAATMRILHGGSVTAANSVALMCEPDIDGLLVGGASLNAKEFAAIVRSGVNA